MLEVLKKFLKSEPNRFTTQPGHTELSLVLREENERNWKNLFFIQYFIFTD